MRYLTIKQTFVYYDEPQLMLGSDGRGVSYLCLAIPHKDSELAYLAVQVSENVLEDYLSESVDLRYVFRHPKKDQYFVLYLDQDKQGRFALNEIADVPEQLLPESGFFASSHTEVESQVAKSASILDIGINGRWDIQDLSEFPNKFADAYSFMFAMQDNVGLDDERLHELFIRYPWRGGFSSVSFYNDLYHQIPRPQRLLVKEIHYASPGAMKITALPDLAKKIETLVIQVNANGMKVRAAFKELHEWMSEKEFLGTTHRDIKLDAADKVILQKACKKLAKELGFDQLRRVYQLCGKDWLATSKILVSFYRRVSELAEFVDSGKATLRTS